MTNNKNIHDAGYCDVEFCSTGEWRQDTTHSWLKMTCWFLIVLLALPVVSSLNLPANINAHLGAKIGPLTQTSHQVSGVVYIASETQIHLVDFTFDGTEPGLFGRSKIVQQNQWSRLKRPVWNCVIVVQNQLLHKQASWKQTCTHFSDIKYV